MRIKKLFCVLILIYIFTIFFITYDYQKYSFLYEHDNFWIYMDNWFQSSCRIPGVCINYLLNYTLPDFFNIHPQDFKSGLGAAIIALLYTIICLIYSTGFCISYCKKFFIYNRYYILSIPLSFLILTNTFNNSSFFPNYFLGIDEITTFLEYFLGYIVYFLFYIVLFRIVVCNKTFCKFEFSIYGVLFILLGLWNELFNISVFFSIILTLVYLQIFDKEKLKNKCLLFIFFSFFIGLLCFYGHSDHLKGTSFNTLEYNLLQELPNNLHNIKYFIISYINFLFCKKIWFFALIFIQLIPLLKLRKIDKNEIFFSINILLGFLLTNILSLFVANLKTGVVYMFERDNFNIIEIHILLFISFILMGYLYKIFSYKRYINYLLIIATIFLSYKLYIIYPSLQNQKIENKKTSYNYEKLCLLYGTLGETAIFPISYLNNSFLKKGKICTMHDQYEYRYKDDFIDFMKNKYFDERYSLYKLSYNKFYKIKFIGFQFKDDDIALRELEKRLILFNDVMDPEEINKNKKAFSDLKKRYGDILKAEDIKTMEKKYGISPITIKAKAYICYKNKEYPEAIKIYNIYLKNNPNDYDALINLAEIYKMQKDYNKAQIIYEKLNNMDKNNMLFWDKLLEIAYENKNYEKAVTICEQAYSIENKLVHPYNINYAIIQYAKSNNKNKEYIENLSNKEKNLIFSYNNVDNIEDLLLKKEIGLIPFRL